MKQSYHLCYVWFPRKYERNKIKKKSEIKEKMKKNKN